MPLAVKPVKAPKVVREAEPQAPEIALPGEGSTTPTNPNANLIGFAEYEKLRGETSGAGEGADNGAPASAGFTPGGGKGSDIVNFAKKFVGVKYAWGKSSPLEGFDCSGLTQYVFKQFGINIPRASWQQGQGGAPVAPGQFQPGDLLFWDNSSRNNGADHVAIYIGNGMMISAPQPGQSVHIVKVNGNPWGRRYL